MEFGHANVSVTFAVHNPRVAGLNRMQLGKDAEVQATRWMRRWAERNGESPAGAHSQIDKESDRSHSFIWKSQRKHLCLSPKETSHRDRLGNG